MDLLCSRLSAFRISDRGRLFALPSMVMIDAGAFTHVHTHTQPQFLVSVFRCLHSYLVPLPSGDLLCSLVIRSGMCESGAQVGALCPPWANQKWQTPAHSATNLSPPQDRLHSGPLIATRRTGLQENRHITLLTLEGAKGVIAEHPSSNYLGMFQHSRVAPTWRVEGSSP